MVHYAENSMYSSPSKPAIGDYQTEPIESTIVPVLVASPSIKRKPTTDVEYIESEYSRYQHALYQLGLFAPELVCTVVHVLSHCRLGLHVHKEDWSHEDRPCRTMASAAAMPRGHAVRFGGQIAVVHEGVMNDRPQLCLGDEECAVLRVQDALFGRSRRVTSYLVTREVLLLLV
ncbi:unnamed protein product [Fusarium venenatum]|uniref:Uncharacterized protein n=1 Tax=Fusarium venenatum TaxID=56646 RepID=A0A2L2STB9_9HYPO|nr:uncharacterized protein FVRRES_13451 [Fusarium venenatum]CEI41165.1 unnamed protein product [Fusarium venenatum]